MGKNTADNTMEKLAQKFGHPTVEWFGSKSLYTRPYRVWVHGWHMHTTKASYGSFCANGKTPNDAAKRLLKNAMEYLVFEGDSCERPCPKYLDDWY